MLSGKTVLLYSGLTKEPLQSKKKIKIKIAVS